MDDELLAWPCELGERRVAAIIDAVTLDDRLQAYAQAARRGEVL